LSGHSDSEGGEGLGGFLAIGERYAVEYWMIILHILSTYL
jgi:hypothetical protein